MNNNSGQEATKDFRNKLSTIPGIAEELGDELKSSVKHIGVALKDVGGAAAEDLGAVANSAYKSMVKTGQKGAKELESRVKESPLVALGLAFGIGLLAAGLFSRRN